MRPPAPHRVLLLDLATERSLDDNIFQKIGIWVKLAP
jgi:hypothetical protein